MRLRSERERSNAFTESQRVIIWLKECSDRIVRVKFQHQGRFDYPSFGLGKAGNWTGPILSESGNVTGFIYRNRILLEPILPKIPKDSARSLSYQIGIGLDRIGTGSYRIIVYMYFFN
ncbi:hypothetical protein H5410_042441 [Solanum commersonii]|uniref:Uncharacterized protein n=1 Tax=Solanum commersonii TaxID=4109 RepID=A0A9J5XWD6_SOLCO|nr:hypothetical protein H5410_042441 [Solanum commersonii]